MTRMSTAATDSPRRQPGGALRALGWPAGLLSLVLVVAACGNSGDDDDAAATAGLTAAPSSGTAVDESADAVEDAVDTGAAAEDTGTGDAASSLEDLASDTGTAVVTIGDETYEFSLAGTATIGTTTYVGLCRSIFGMIQGNGYATDGRDITVDMEVPPVDWETYTDDRYDPPAIKVEDNEANASWVADQGDEFVTGSGVGEFELDGASASGTATFVNQWAPDSDPVEGTFEIDCEG